MGAIGSVVTWDEPGSSDLFTALRNDTPIPDKPSAPRVKVGPGDIGFNCWGPATWATNATGFRRRWLPGRPRLRGLLTATTKYDPGYNVSLKTLKPPCRMRKQWQFRDWGRTFRVTVGAGPRRRDAGLGQRTRRHGRPALRPATSAAERWGSRGCPARLRCRAEGRPSSLASTVFTNGPLWARRHRDAVRPQMIFFGAPKAIWVVCWVGHQVESAVAGHRRPVPYGSCRNVS